MFTLNAYSVTDQEIVSQAPAEVKRQRIVVMSLINFRDIGENLTRIKSGNLFRSGSLHAATEKDCRYLKEIGIATILDLRLDVEIDLAPNKLPEDVRYIKLPPPLQRPKPIPGVYQRIVAKTALPPGEDMCMDYREMCVRYKDAFSTALHLIMETKDPILFHCQNGKDRTGALSALVLALLGVSKEEIYADYLASNAHIAAKNKTDLSRMSEGFNDMQKEQLLSIMEARENYLTAFFKGIEDSFGGVELYVSYILKIEKSTIDNFRAFIMTP